MERIEGSQDAATSEQTKAADFSGLGMVRGALAQCMRDCGTTRKSPGSDAM